MDNNQEIVCYNGHKCTLNITDDCIKLLDDVIKNYKFKSFIDLYNFLFKYRKVIDFVLQETDNVEEDDINFHNLLRSRLFSD
jgi:hypothetical protein